MLDLVRKMFMLTCLLLRFGPFATYHILLLLYIILQKEEELFNILAHSFIENYLHKFSFENFILIYGLNSGFVKQFLGFQIF
jgi:hypothetical protein